MAYQRGCLKKVRRKEGESWVLRYRVTNAEGKRLENTLPVGLVQDFPKEKGAWRGGEKLGLSLKINEAPPPSASGLTPLRSFISKPISGRMPCARNRRTLSKPRNTLSTTLIPRWRDAVAEDIEPIVIQRWLKSLLTDSGLAWLSVAEIRGVMSRICKGQLHGRLTKNPVEHVQTRYTSDHRAIVLTPEQALSLRWADIRGLISASAYRNGAEGKDGKTNTETSDGYVPLHPILASPLPAWRQGTLYGTDQDFVFPSLRAEGRVPLSPCPFVADHLRKAAKQAGVVIAESQRFGLHNLRHSLSNWLVNKAKVEPKTVQDILRHSPIQTTLDLYTQKDNDEARAAQGEFLRALGMHSQLIQ